MQGSAPVRYSGVVLCLVSLFGHACQASVSANANVGAEANIVEPEAEGAPAASPSPAPAGAAPAAQAQSSAGSGRPLLGARHDLSLVPERATAKCNCLDVGVGAANAETFRWQSRAPDLDPETQLIVAVSTSQAHCTGTNKKKQALGASYWGYRIVGNDVVVFVEAAHRGRPLTAGAIIPKPVGEGQVWLSPASKQLPFGRPLEGKGTRCKVGNPGPARTTPHTAEELGTNTEPSDAPAQEPG